MSYTVGETLMRDKNSIIKTTVQYIKARGEYPTLVDLNSVGITRAMVRQHFDSLEGLNTTVYPLVKDYVLDLQRSAYSTKVNSKIKRFVVTTAVTGHKVNARFLANVNKYCQVNKAELVVIPAIGDKKLRLDVALKDAVIVTSGLKLNNNCSVLGIKTSSTTRDTTAGLAGVGQRSGTFITGSPKQRIKFVATGKNKLPHALISTGAITQPNYFKNTLYGDLINKTNFVADHDHTIGAMIVEIESDEIYHFRQITADSNGDFVDLGQLFKNGKVGIMLPSDLVMGDWHSGKTCPIVREATLSLADALKVARLIGHDVFDASSISHHEVGRWITLAKKAAKGGLSLEAELKLYAKDLADLSKRRKFVIVKSNHDEHLERYLNEARYKEDPHNHAISLKLAAALLAGENPLEYYVRDIAKINLKNITFLKRDEDFIVSGIQLGAHGDKGANGSRASIAQMENSFGNVVYGHSHTPELLRGAVCVGTSTARKPDYGDGPSSWMNTHCLVYPNGTRQMINLIEGKFTTKKL